MLLKLVVVAVCVVLATGSRMEMPSLVTVGSKVKIECHLDRGQSEILHVQWYKDNKLFYVFNPIKEPSEEHIDLLDVPLDVKESKFDTIILNPVILESSGVYTCELISVANLVRMSGTLNVKPAEMEKELS